MPLTKLWQQRNMQISAIIAFLGVAGIAGQHLLLRSPTPKPTAKNNQTSHLRAIAVKILANKKPIGSGVLISSQDGWYRVITNQHVLRSRPQPWQIQTFDQKIYPAQAITPSSWSGLDLSLLKFPAMHITYATAKIDKSARLQIGETVIAGGFPLSPQKSADAQGFFWSKGQVKHLLAKPLVEGYQIGYSNSIHKGMSGGPLLNSRGELVGINGIHDQPLWNAPETFADGTTLPEKLQTEIGNFSWAIPAHKLPQP